jgi:hypothetical protein
MNKSNAFIANSTKEMRLVNLLLAGTGSEKGKALIIPSSSALSSSVSKLASNVLVCVLNFHFAPKMGINSDPYFEITEIIFYTTTILIYNIPIWVSILILFH